MPAGLYYKNLILGICFRLITMNRFQWSNDLKIRAQIQWFKIVSWKGKFEFAFHLWHCEPPLKDPLWEREYLFLLFWSDLIVGGSLVTLERWERWDGGVGKKKQVGGWWGGKLKGFWFYSRLGDAKWVQDFIFLFLVLIKGTKRWDEFKIFVWPQGRKDSPYIFHQPLEI